MAKLDYNKAIEIAPGVFWVGYNFKDIWFHTNPYLVVEGDEAVLIDPGSQVDFTKVLEKARSVCPVENIKYIILHHQDPDLCGSTVEFEKLTELTVYTPERSAVFSKFYGIKSLIVPVAKDGESITFRTGRKLEFFLTPYCHSPGAMVTYDRKNRILFTSDIFGAFNLHWELFADMYLFDEHLKSVKLFMEPYMASRAAVDNFLKKAQTLDIEMVCPQHGSVIREDPKRWFDELKKMRFGTAITKGASGLELWK
jgi:two-component system cell cycle response regulator